MDDPITLGAIDPGPLHDHLPIGVVVIDRAGRIRHANRRAADMVGRARDDVVGRSIVEFVAEDDLDFMVAVLIGGESYPGTVLGPGRLRYKHADGTERWTEYWAHDIPPELGFDGYVITLAAESVTANLANAAFQIASDEPLTKVLGTLTRAVSGHPLLATGSMLVGDARSIDLVGTWPFDGAHLIDPSMPWHRVLSTGEGDDVDVADLSEPLRASAAEAGFRSAWIRPVVTQRIDTAGVFIAWRREPGPASRNQERHLAEVVGLARLAFDHDDHRAELERAALSDHLTGVGNRARLAKRLGLNEPAVVAVMFVDLDGFKAVNDRHGHDVGDVVLATSAKRLSAVVRRADDVFRIGGDEFVVLCDVEDAGADRVPLDDIATRIIGALRQPIRMGGLELEISASIGIAIRSPSESTPEVIRRADQALLAAKRLGKGRWQHADPDAT